MEEKFVLFYIECIHEQPTSTFYATVQLYAKATHTILSLHHTFQSRIKLLTTEISSFMLEAAGQGSGNCNNLLMLFLPKMAMLMPDSSSAVSNWHE